MAAKPKRRFVQLHKLAAAVCLLTLVVMLASGLLAGVPMLTVAYRACFAMVGVKLISRVLVTVLSTYEEMNSGQT